MFLNQYWQKHQCITICLKLRHFSFEVTCRLGWWVSVWRRRSEGSQINVLLSHISVLTVGLQKTSGSTPGGERALGIPPLCIFCLSIPAGELRVQFIKWTLCLILINLDFQLSYTVSLVSIDYKVSIQVHGPFWRWSFPIRSSSPHSTFFIHPPIPDFPRPSYHIALSTKSCPIKFFSRALSQSTDGYLTSPKSSK